MQDLPKHQGQRRQLMQLIAQKGIKDEQVLQAMTAVPRHFFMDKGLENWSYEDKAYPIAAEQTISQPYTVAFQTSLLQINPGDKVLEIGTGSGYQTAVLLQLGAHVYTIERQNELFKKTQRLFEKLHLKPKKVIFGDGYKGFSEAAPYKGIIVTAAAPQVPEALLEQLAVGGRLVIPVGTENQQMYCYTRTASHHFDKTCHGAFRFVPLLENKN
jgi:protein-L-isoaspartate(D-aspartate) O-methyltransferase